MIMCNNTYNAYIRKCVWMPTVHRSAFTVATFYGMSEIHDCLDCLQLALLPSHETATWL